eukprot:CAMPEP_0168303964 /NCGR_PEP_ID=MMETSP0142_2-20121227/45068_1 /TAXON_ID=44445 /ORGANISM="Pseudo-nitzschia australis, Strain 10249 10 AB" /LENGTH=228 /DNA_ID=CAMNT_0008255039 /DNA_START=194 /DNA_END=880 /DNA_ORIENTATION=-
MNRKHSSCANLNKGNLDLHVLHASDRSDKKGKMLPKAIIFDLDGCLWTPEMYEIMFFMGGKGSPFKKDPKSDRNLLTCNNKPVRLLGDVRSIFEDLYTQPDFEDVKIGISSRTDEPNWARELLTKFEVTENERGQPIYLINVIDGPVEIAKDSKKEHFRRINIETGIEYEDMLFFDNEFGNCDKIASLGVSVVYCPDGVTRTLWDMGVHDDFPKSDGSVINGEQRGWR